MSTTDTKAILEAWAKSEGLIHESHGVMAVSSTYDISRKAFYAGYQAAADAAKAAGTAGEQEVPSVNRIITQLETAERGFICPLCGKDYPHGHTPAEISIYRNGIKAGIHQKELAGAEHPGVTEDAGLDAGATGASCRTGSHQRHEHRGRQSGNQRLDCGSDGACDGLPGSGEVREVVAEAARQPAPVSVSERDMAIAQAVRQACVNSYSPDDSVSDYTEKMGDIDLATIIRAATNRSQP